MEKLSERTRRRIYNRVAMMFRRRAKALGVENWKWEVQINGLRFEEYLAEELRNFDPERESLSPAEAIEQFRKGILGDEEPPENREKTEYSLNPQVLRLWDAQGEEERFNEMKSLEKEVNKELEANRIPTCKRCHCNPCICRDEY